MPPFDPGSPGGEQQPHEPGYGHDDSSYATATELAPIVSAASR